MNIRWFSWAVGLALFLSGSNVSFSADAAGNNNPRREGKKVNGAHVNQFYLIDPQTQMLVLKYKHPAGWMTSGKAQWLPNNPTMPHAYFTWAASPDGQQKFFISSNLQFAGQGHINQNPLASNPNVLAQQLFGQAVAKDYQLTNVRFVGARFVENPNNPQQIRQNIAATMAAQGLRAVDVRPWIFDAEFRGTRGGKEFFVKYLSPVNIVEQLSGWASYNHIIEFVLPMSFGGPVESAGSLEKLVTSTFSTLEFNPKFLEFRNNVSRMQTQQAMAAMNQRFEMFRERHRQNMAEMDARAEARQRESDRKHAQVMGRGSSGGMSSSGGSGSMLDKWDEYIKDVDLVQNPNGGDMYIDNRYDHAWINSDNEVMYMDSGSFNPNENAAFNHREWKRVR